MTCTLITGATAGLGRALSLVLADRGNELILTGRDPARLAALAAELPTATVVAGDIADTDHQHRLAQAVGDRLDLLVHNASELGPSPLVELADLTAAQLTRILQVNVVAPTALTAALLPALRASDAATVVSISSDVALENHPTWGGYAASKTALDHLAGTWAAENPEVRFLAVDPGDMRTAMHQAAFAGEDISDRPRPDQVAVPGILGLLAAAPASGRYRAADFVADLSSEVAS